MTFRSPYRELEIPARFCCHCRGLLHATMTSMDDSSKEKDLIRIGNWEGTGNALVFESALIVWTHAGTFVLPLITDADSPGERNKERFS